jgi:Insect cuticle protein
MLYVTCSFKLQSFIAITLVALAAAAPAPDAPKYGYAPAPAYAPAYPAYKEPAYEASPYAFNYAVDDYYGNKFSHEEKSDGYGTAGSYSVALPDGRLQTVNYNVADDYSGYVADVVYTGEAAYPAYSKPAYSPAPYAPAPAPYTPAPAPYAPAPYVPAPAYKPAPYKPAPYKPAPYYKPAPVYTQ